MTLPAWTQALRTEGLAQFEDAGLPSRRIEAWHYTDLSQAGLDSLPIAHPSDAVGGAPGVIHLINGFLVSFPASLPDGVTFERLDTSPLAAELVGHLALSAELPMAALNAALFSDGLALRVAAGAQITTPIEIRSEAWSDHGAQQFHNRLLVVLEEGASVTLVETHCGRGVYFSNSVVEIQLAARARLNHVKLQLDSSQATHVAVLAVHLAEAAQFDGVLLQLGGRLARHEVHALLAGRGASFLQSGASLALGQQHLDNTTRVVHRAPACQSRQIFKTVLDQEGHGVFQGNVLVERPAQKTNAHQLSRALMLSDRAAMDNKPELEIYADDVKCGHGATIGDIDDQALFYLRARGIDAALARRLLIAAFLRDVVEQITDPDLQERADHLLEARLADLTVRAPT